MTVQTTKKKLKQCLKLFSLCYLTSINLTSIAEAPSINGRVAINVTVESVSTISSADSGVSQVIVGSFLEGEANSFEVLVGTGNLSAIADADNSCSQIIIGSVVGSTACNPTQ